MLFSKHSHMPYAGHCLSAVFPCVASPALSQTQTDLHSVPWMAVHWWGCIIYALYSFLVVSGVGFDVTNMCLHLDQKEQPKEYKLLQRMCMTLCSRYRLVYPERKLQCRVKRGTSSTWNLHHFSHVP